MGQGVGGTAVYVGWGEQLLCSSISGSEGPELSMNPTAQIAPEAEAAPLRLFWTGAGLRLVERVQAEPFQCSASVLRAPS